MRDHDHDPGYGGQGGYAAPLALQDPYGPPRNIEAEQAFIGAVLYDNEVHHRVSAWLRPEHFHDPLHGAIYRRAAELIDTNALADAVTLRSDFESEPGMTAVGGVGYLARLMAEAPDSVSAPEYARVIYDLAIRRALIEFGGEVSHEASKPSDALDAAALLESAEQRLFKMAESGGASRRQAVSLRDSMSEAVRRACAAHASGKGVSGLSTGLRSLDQRMGGLNRSDLIILGARPSMGKSGLAMNIAFALARAFKGERGETGAVTPVTGGRVLLFSLEMSADQLSARILADITGVGTHRQRTGRLQTRDLEMMADAAAELAESPLWIDDTGGMDISQLCARARRHKRMHGLDLVVVDYLQLVRAKGHDYSKVQEVSEVTARLKALAKELDVPVLALAQLSRQVEQRDDKKPQLSDLRESGAIEQDADVVMFLYRHAYYLERLEPKTGTAEHLAWEDEMREVRHQAEIILAKQRHGPIGSVKLHFDPERVRFSDLADSSYDEVMI